MVQLPLLRNYFLGVGLRPTCRCHRAGNAKPCVACELDAFVAAMHGAGREPISPSDLLYAWWAFAEDLAGYRQQVWKCGAKRAGRMQQHRIHSTFTFRAS